MAQGQGRPFNGGGGNNGGTVNTRGKLQPAKVGQQVVGGTKGERMIGSGGSADLDGVKRNTADALRFQLRAARDLHTPIAQIRDMVASEYGESYPAKK